MATKLSKTSGLALLEIEHRRQSVSVTGHESYTNGWFCVAIIMVATPIDHT